jgi:hypothetical protein
MPNLGQGYWECRRMGGTHTRDTGEKGRKSCRSKPAASFSPVFALRVAGLNINYSKFYMGPISGLVEIW